LDRHGRELAERLQLAQLTPPVDVAIRLHGGAPPLAAGMNWLITSRGFRRKLMVVAQRLVPPPRFMRAWSPLARTGRLGLALSYVWRPIWVAFHVPPAARALWRARRAVRSASGARRHDV
jgi:hypothetical protein